MDDDAGLFAGLRPLLFSIAYRMVGSVSDAEDVVQDAYLRWDRTARKDVESPKAYLTSVVTRLCIDHLRSARVQREAYVGPWLPEPVLTGTATGGVEEHAEMADSLSMAFLVLLESLSPVERAVLLLHEVFGYGYGEIAELVGRSEANCRQLLVRARRHVEARRPRFEASPQEQAALSERFMAASSNGDMEGLLDLLSDDIVLWSDGGGKVQAARRPIVGPARVARFVLGLVKKAAGAWEATPAEINGQPGFVLAEGGRRIAVLTLDVGGGRITGIRIVVNPDKLGGLSSGVR